MFESIHYHAILLYISYNQKCFKEENDLMKFWSLNLFIEILKKTISKKITFNSNHVSDCVYY